MLWTICALLIATSPSSPRLVDFPVRIEVASKGAFVVITDEMTDQAEEASGFVPVMHHSDDGALPPGIPVRNDTGGEYSWMVTAVNLYGFTFSDVFSFTTAGCPGDFDGDGMATVLDFVAFQSAFDDMEPNADCNADGNFNILDFTCFQTNFNSCP